jgi:uncharacterized protein
MNMSWMKAGAAAGLALMLMAAAPASVLDGLPFTKKLKLAQVGDDEAQYAVGFSYEAGVDVKEDRTEAAVWYRKAAKQGHLDAMFRLARLVQEGTEGLQASPETAFKLYEAAAKKNHPESQNWLGYCYQHGIGVAASPTEAVIWYRKAADSGVAVAQNNLGLMFLNGKGVPRDFAKAFAQFERAAGQGDGWGLNNLGGLYEMGWGVAPNKDKALDYYKLAKARGIESAAENIRRLTAAAVVEPVKLEKPNPVEETAKVEEKPPEKPKPEIVIIRPPVKPVEEPVVAEEKPVEEPEADLKRTVEEPLPEPKKVVVWPTAEPDKPEAATAQTDGSESNDPAVVPDVAEAKSGVKTDSSSE